MVASSQPQALAIFIADKEKLQTHCIEDGKCVCQLRGFIALITSEPSESSSINSDKGESFFFFFETSVSFNVKENGSYSA